MLLYDNAISGNCYKVRLLLAQLGISYERRNLSVADRSNRPQVLGGLNPSLRVPTIVLDDGRPLGESNAILWYFGEGTPYVPTDRYERAQALQWQFFEQYDHEPNIAVARFWLHYREDEVDQAALAARQAGGYRALDAMEKHLDWAILRRRALLRRGHLSTRTRMGRRGGFDLERYPAIRAWLARVAAQPRHITIDT
jgi:glutathione S-transferase